MSVQQWGCSKSLNLKYCLLRLDAYFYSQHGWTIIYTVLLYLEAPHAANDDNIFAFFTVTKLPAKIYCVTLSMLHCEQNMQKTLWSNTCKLTLTDDTTNHPNVRALEPRYYFIVSIKKFFISRSLTKLFLFFLMGRELLKLKNQSLNKFSVSQIAKLPCAFHHLRLLCKPIEIGVYT